MLASPFAPLAEEIKEAHNYPIVHLTEEPPLPKGYPRNKVTKAQRAELLEELRRRYRERKAQQTAEKGKETEEGARTSL